jgi:6-phosphogluconolactonase
MKSERPTVDVFPDVASLMTAAADRVVRAAGARIAAAGRFSIALSGGSTPKALYELLAEPRYAALIDWSKAHVFWGDERVVPPRSADSNYRMANEALLERVPIPANHVHRILAEQGGDEAALSYEATLHTFFEGSREASFDILLLGMGPDGHIASLFPGTEPVHENERWVRPNVSPVPPVERVTLTPAILNRSASVLLLVTGAEKAGRLAQILEGPFDPARLPAQVIRPPNGDVRWLVDRLAASKLVGKE